MKTGINIIETTTKETPTHVVINSKALRANKAYTSELEANEEAIIEAVIYGQENIKVVPFSELVNPVLVNELDICGGESKVINNNKHNIL